MQAQTELNPFRRTHEVLTRYLKEWAFTVSLSGDSVQVHSRQNTQFVKDKLQEHGLEMVRVSYISDGRAR